MRNVCGAVALSLGFVTPGTAWAGSFDLFDTISGEYKLTTTYGVGIRTEKPHENLINGPIDPLVSEPPMPPDRPFPRFGHTGLPDTYNFDDGNRNFDQYSLIANRFTGFGELELRWGDVGIVTSGVAHYDWVPFGNTDNTSPESLNTFQPHTEFTQQAQETNGERIRPLDYYVYGTWLLGGMSLDVRAGSHLVAWGESLFFPGIVTAQNPNDATKAFSPGAEVKEILLPVNQVSTRIGIGNDLTLLGYYQLRWEETEIFPVGDFFSPADVVGPGSQFAHGSVNPAFGDGCPGLLETPITSFDFICQQEGVGGPLLNAEPTIKAIREADIIPPDSGQWGAGLTYQLTSRTNLGGYYLKYHNHNPGVKLNVGFAKFGEDPATGEELTTETTEQYVPVSYNITYADNITMYAASWSSVFFGVNFAGEFIRRENIDVPVEATISGVVAPVGSRGITHSAQFSWLYTTNPNFLFYDEVPFVGEAGYMIVEEVDPKTNEPGICYSGTDDCEDFSQQGGQLFYDKETFAFQFLALPKGRNVFSGWDLGTPITFSWLVKGTPSVAGQWGALYGEGDMRTSLGITLQYVQNLEFALTHNWFFGDPYKNINNSRLRENPYTDHDYATFTIKYNL